MLEFTEIEQEASSNNLYVNSEDNVRENENHLAPQTLVANDNQSTLTPTIGRSPGDSQ